MMTRAKAIEIVERLDKIRVTLNGIDRLAGMDSAYGDVRNAIVKVLAEAFGRHAATLIYRDMLENGNAVRESCAAYQNGYL
jgi:hypothetical protein